MAQTIEIQSWYSIAANAHVTLPEGKTWKDVEDYYVKWGTLHACIAGEWLELADVGDLSLDSVDYKRPTSIEIYPVKEDGDTDYETLLSAKS